MTAINALRSIPARTDRLAPPLARQGGAVIRLVFAALMVVQLLAGVVAPVLHARSSRPLAAHLDQPGSPHQTHDEASCATCAVPFSVGRVERSANVLPLVLVAVVAAAAYDERVVATRVDPTRSPRAPPSIA